MDNKKLPTPDDLYNALETKMPSEVKQAILASRLMNPLLEGRLPQEMSEKTATYRKYQIEERIVCDSVGEFVCHKCGISFHDDIEAITEHMEKVHNITAYAMSEGEEFKRLEEE